MIDVGSAVGYLLLDTSQWESGFRAARTGLRTFTDETSSAADKWSAAGKLMGSTGKALTLGVTAPLVGLGAASVKTAADFEASMSNVKAISGATAEEMERLTEKAQEMGAKTKFSASEASEAMSYMAMAGWETQDMLDGIEGIMNLAAASGESLATTSDIVTDALTAFGLTAKDTQMFVDVLASAASSTNTNVSMLGESFKYVAPVAGTFGYSVQDIGVALGLMANSGIKASQAGTSLRSALSRMIKPTEQASTYMEELGLYSDGVVTAMTNADGTMKPFRETMQILRDTFGELSEAEQAQAASAIFGQEAMAGMLAIINSTEEDFDKLIETMDTAAGTSEEMAETQLDNLSGQLTILKSGVEGAAIAFGNLLIPLVKDVAGFLQEVVTWVNNLDEDQKKLIVTIAEILVVVGPVLIILSKIISLVMALGPLISGMGAIIGLLSGPIGLIIGALALFAAAWTTNFGNIREIVGGFIEFITGGLNGLMDLLGFFGDKLSGLLDKLAFWKRESEGLNASPIGGETPAGGSYSGGLGYVPRDMNVRVHEGEAILTKQQNQERNQGNGGPETLVIPISVGEEQIETVIVDLLKREVRT